MYPIFNNNIERISRSLRTRFRIIKDWMEVFLGMRHPLIPPKRYDYINIGGNEQIGKDFFGYFIDLCDLKPSHHVLEVGSGFGRMAIPLTTYLNSSASYNGLEIIKDGVNWCQSKFTKRYPNFRFQCIDVYNTRYNPKGKVTASNYVFPFGDHVFDFVYLTSVFTHMYAEDIKNYLSEIKRVLKKGGRCLITYYLLNEFSIANIEQNKGTYNFKFKVKNYRIEDPNDPLYQIAYPEVFIRSLYERYGLEIQEPIRYGSWSGSDNYLNFQDIVIASFP